MWWEDINFVAWLLVNFMFVSLAVLRRALAWTILGFLALFVGYSTFSQAYDITAAVVFLLLLHVGAFLYVLKSEL